MDGSVIAETTNYIVFRDDDGYTIKHRQIEYPYPRYTKSRIDPKDIKEINGDLWIGSSNIAVYGILDDEIYLKSKHTFDNGIVRKTEMYLNDNSIEIEYGDNGCATSAEVTISDDMFYLF